MTESDVKTLVELFVLAVGFSIMCWWLESQEEEKKKDLLRGVPLFLVAVAWILWAKVHILMMAYSGDWFSAAVFASIYTGLPVYAIWTWKKIKMSTA